MTRGAPVQSLERVRGDLPRRAALCALLGLVAVGGTASAQRADDHHELSARFTSWLTAVARHAPGEPDAHAALVVTLDETALRDVLRDLDALDKAMGRASPQRPFRPRGTAADGSLLSSRDTLALLGVGEPPTVGPLVTRAVLLHTDLAVFLRDGRLDASTAGAALDDRRSLTVRDGQHRGYGARWPHWEFAQQLFARRLHDPADADVARTWYSAAAAHMYATGQLDRLQPHLQEGARAFPRDADIQFYTGLLEARLASPELQQALQLATLPSGTRRGTSDARRHLDLARRAFERALARAPAMSEARVRLGHVLVAQGQSREAVTVLEQALGDAALESSLRYCAELFLGDALALEGDDVGARQALMRAADLTPGAQSPWMAMSRLARRTGDVEEAAALLEAVLAPSPRSRRVDDPWWDYYQRDFTTPERLLDTWRVRALGGGKTP